jgi:uncharacterized protein YyaL (SSP411 family)
VTATPNRRPNHLAGQTSPYLLQHLYNPVDWYPWGAEALAKAKRENKPIFVSIGYAACHWCHVMEHESFENDAIAALLNASFVPIKVDREERPDLDEIYMTAVQLMTGQGGWPLNVFLTPDGKPFFGGTYFPPEDRAGRRGFPGILEAVRDAWASRRDEIAGSADGLAAHILEATQVPAASGGSPVGSAEDAQAAAELARRYDPHWGGFGPAPKFPPHGAIGLLLRHHAATGDAASLAMAAGTLDRMARGGMYDQIGGGFARYSVDERWLVPHFEKMLYDQALLVPVYTDGWLATGKPAYRRVVLETLDFVRRELTDPEGGFWSSLDADSEGHEGRFYVWSPAEVEAALGTGDGTFVCSTYGIDARGNFEGKSIPNRLDGEIDDALAARLRPLRAKLLAARKTRVRPATDDKVLTAWNGLMISAFARAYQAFGREEDLTSARRAADFVRRALWKDGRLLVAWRRGTAQLPAYLDDYAFFARGLVDLYEADFDRRDLDDAAAIARALVAHFGDGAGGFHFTADDHEALLARTKSTWDGALPAGSGVATEALLRIGLHTGDKALSDAAGRTLVAMRPSVARSPSAFAALLAAAAYGSARVPEIVIVGPRHDPATASLLSMARSVYLPARAIALCDRSAGASDLPLLEGKTLLSGRPAAYVCRSSVCDAPVSTPDALGAALRR